MSDLYVKAVDFMVEADSEQEADEKFARVGLVYDEILPSPLGRRKPKIGVDPVVRVTNVERSELL